MRGVLWTKAEDDFLIVARQQEEPMTFAAIGKFLKKTESAARSRYERMTAAPKELGYERVAPPKGSPLDFVPRLLSVHPGGYQDGPVKQVRRVYYSPGTSVPVLRSSMA